MENFRLLTVSGLTKVLPLHEPQLPEKSGTTLRNESFGFQVSGYYAGNESLLLCRAEVRGALAPYTTLRIVEPVPVYSTRLTDDYMITHEPALIPDVLRPIGGAGIGYRGKIWTSLYVTVAGDLPVGTHDITVAILKSNGEPIDEVTYTLKVIDSVLPDTSLKYTCWMHYDCMEMFHNAPFMSDRFLEVAAQYFRSGTSHGVNMVYTPLFTPPLDTKIGGERPTAQLVDVEYKDGKYSFGLDKLGKFLDIAFQCGMKYIEFSHLFTQWGAEHCPKIMANTEEGYRKIFGWEDSSLGEEYLNFLSSFLKVLVEFIDGRGLRDICYFHISDEPNASHLKTFEPISVFMKDKLSGFKFIEALSDYTFYQKGLVKIPVVATDHVADFVNNDVYHWVYYCCTQVNKYLSNRIINMPSERTRILGCQLYLNGVDGFLQWGYNFYYTHHALQRIDPYQITDSGGAFPAGDAFAVYPGENGPVESLRNELMKEAMQDYRALSLLGSLIGREAVIKMLQNEGMKGYTDYPHSAEWLISFRSKVNQLIEQNS